jgi:hypothetical protein
MDFGGGEPRSIIQKLSKWDRRNWDLFRRAGRIPKSIIQLRMKDEPGSMRWMKGLLYSLYVCARPYL